MTSEGIYDDLAELKISLQFKSLKSQLVPFTEQNFKQVSEFGPTMRDGGWLSDDDALL